MIERTSVKFLFALILVCRWDGEMFTHVTPADGVEGIEGTEA